MSGWKGNGEARFMAGMHCRLACNISLRRTVSLWKEVGHPEGPSPHQHSGLLASPKYVDSEIKGQLGKTVKVGVVAGER